MEDLDKKWNIRQIVEETIKSSHNKPSAETLKRLEFLEANQIKFMEKMDNLEEKIDAIKVSLASLPDEIFRRADERYASKIYEKAMYGLIGAIVLAVIYAILNLVVK